MRLAAELVLRRREYCVLRAHGNYKSQSKHQKQRRQRNQDKPHHSHSEGQHRSRACGKQKGHITIQEGQTVQEEHTQQPGQRRHRTHHHLDPSQQDRGDGGEEEGEQRSGRRKGKHTHPSTPPRRVSRHKHPRVADSHPHQHQSGGDEFPARGTGYRSEHMRQHGKTQQWRQDHFHTNSSTSTPFLAPALFTPKVDNEGDGGDDTQQRAEQREDQERQIQLRARIYQQPDRTTKKRGKHNRSPASKQPRSQV